MCLSQQLVFMPALGDDVAGDFAEGAPCTLGGKRLVPPLLLDIPGRVYEPPLETPTPCAHTCSLCQLKP